MHEFKKPELSDKEWVDALLKRPDNRNCELCFGNLFIWSSVYQNLIISYDGFLIVKNANEYSNGYSFPIGNGDLRRAMRFVLSDAHSEGKSCKLYGLTSVQQEALEVLYPGKFQFTANRDHADYIYRVEQLATLSGKKLHGKRNHITNFKKSYPNWSYEPIAYHNVSECLKMHLRWIDSNDPARADAGYQDELKAVKLAFDHFEELGFVGGLIRVNGQVVAFTFGEPINDQVFCTHIEKAFSQMRGAYPIINQAFAQNALSGYLFVNREEDLGLEGLRKAKLSYYPEILLEKTTAIYMGDSV